MLAIAIAQLTSFAADGTPNAGTLLLDHNGNDLGWFIDSTPWENSEFAQPLSDSAYRATTSPAAGRYDLLTTILHEMGHLAGLIQGNPALYRYVFNSPTNFTDPSGLRTEIYVHSGKTWYGHVAININGTVYTYGRYGDARAKPRTGGMIGEGYFYLVSEQFYLNSENFTPKEDTVTRFQIQLKPEEEKKIQRYLNNLYEKATQPNTTQLVGEYKNARKPNSGKYISGGAEGEGRILRGNYNFLINNCTTFTLNLLPNRVQIQLGNIRTGVSFMNPDRGALNLLPNISPPALDNFLRNGGRQKPNLIRELPKVPPLRRSF